MLIFKLFYETPYGNQQYYSRMNSLVEVCLARDYIIDLYDGYLKSRGSVYMTERCETLYKIFDDIWESYRYDSLRITRCVVYDANSYDTITDASFDPGLYITKYHAVYYIRKKGECHDTFRPCFSGNIGNCKLVDEASILPSPFTSNAEFDFLASVISPYTSKDAPSIKNVIFNPPATVVFWDDGTKTVVKCDEELFDMMYSTDVSKIDETLEWYGIAMALLKKTYGNEYHKIIQNGLDKSIYHHNKEEVYNHDK